MATERKFADFYVGALPFQMDKIPEGGMCLSAFLVLWKGNQHNVLLGKVNPASDWVQLGALSKERAEKISDRWILPSSHLLLYESPHEAVRRISREQLGLNWSDVKSPELLVFSEAYSVPTHWDIEFVFKGELESLPRSAVWKELTFVDVSKAHDKDFARSHQDILTEVGLR
jgi:ADP-ribose pyrophosphatase YjhB (NUDIX family)